MKMTTHERCLGYINQPKQPKPITEESVIKEGKDAYDGGYRDGYSLSGDYVNRASFRNNHYVRMMYQSGYDFGRMEKMEEMR